LFGLFVQGKELERALPFGVEVFGAHLVPHMTVRSVAQLSGAYIQSLKKQMQSSQSIVLLGCGVAGAIAYEMAHQLTRAGESVARLVLVRGPFFDERAYAGSPANAREATATVAELCRSYAKKKSSVLPVEARLFVEPEYKEEGMDDILQQTLFKVRNIWLFLFCLNCINTARAHVCVRRSRGAVLSCRRVFFFSEPLRKSFCRIAERSVRAAHALVHTPRAP
jgi:hypothetical protein